MKIKPGIKYSNFSPNMLTKNNGIAIRKIESESQTFHSNMQKAIDNL